MLCRPVKLRRPCSCQSHVKRIQTVRTSISLSFTCWHSSWAADLTPKPWSPRNQKCLQHAPSLLFHPTTASWSFPPNPFFELRLINIFDTEIIFSPVPSPLLWILTPFSRHDKYIHNSLWDRFAFSFCCTSSICNFLAPSSFKREIPPHSYPHPSH